MEIKQLEYFKTVCKELHFTNAAKRLNISQPSLSQQIRILESEIGKPLFNRIGKKISVTEAGQILLEHSNNILAELKEIEQAIDDMNNLTRGRVSIGALLTIVSYLIPNVVLRYNYLFPDITMNVTGLNSRNIRRKLLQGELDLGISMLEEDDKELESIPLFTESFSLAVPIDHVLAKEDIVPLTVLEKTKNILLPDYYYTRKLLNKHCESLGFELKAFVEVETMEALITMVEYGAGVTILADPYLRFKQSDKIKIISLISPAPIRKIGVSYVKDKYMNRAAQAFIEELKIYVEETIY